MSARAPAPEFPADLEWVNARQPPRVADLRGRVGLLWFWTYDAVNCWNMMRELRQLADRYHDGLGVIGLHCPKYPQQCDGEALLHAVDRFGLRHAVANDAAFRVWQDYAVEAWPTIVLIDAEGGVAARLTGEGGLAELDARVAALLEEASSRDARVYGPPPPVVRPRARGALAFPGGVLADGELLYVADSGHHRILECRHDGRIVRSFGAGHAGFVDGPAGEAAFDHPRGLARARDSLYVADRGNHAVRRIDLAAGRVDTVLGNGIAGRSRPDRADPALTTPNTPLALAAIGDQLFVAVAGQNQVWCLDLAANQVSVLAGSGELGLVDGSAAEACLAQPSGVAVWGRHLLVADAAASALRWIDSRDGRVETLLGTGLYEFGDATGKREDARLQNPLAVAIEPHGMIFVADSYNHSLKLFDRKRGSVRALPLQHRLDEPQALALADNRLWIANTNLHEIVCVDLANGMARRVPVGET